MNVGLPAKLLYESIGHTVTIELKSGDTVRGNLVSASIVGYKTHSLQYTIVR